MNFNSYSLHSHRLATGVLNQVSMSFEAFLNYIRRQFGKVISFWHYATRTPCLQAVNLAKPIWINYCPQPCQQPLMRQPQPRMLIRFKPDQPQVKLLQMNRRHFHQVLEQVEILVLGKFHTFSTKIEFLLQIKCFFILKDQRILDFKHKINFEALSELKNIFSFMRTFLYSVLVLIFMTTFPTQRLVHCFNNRWRWRRGHFNLAKEHCNWAIRGQPGFFYLSLGCDF